MPSAGHNNLNGRGRIALVGTTREDRGQESLVARYAVALTHGLRHRDPPRMRDRIGHYRIGSGAWTIAGTLCSIHNILQIFRGVFAGRGTHPGADRARAGGGGAHTQTFRPSDSEQLGAIVNT